MLKNDGYLRPVLLQVLGIGLLVGFSIFWVFTGRESALLVGAGLTLAAVGSAGGAIVTVRQEAVERAMEHKQQLSELEETR